MKTRFSIIAAVLLAASVSAGAQSFETGFFLDNWSYGFRINPSFQNETNVIGLLISNATVNTTSNTGLGQFIFPGGNGLVTGLNSAVSAGQFLGGLPTTIKVAEDVGVNIATVCFWNKKGTAYNTIEVNAREYGTSVVPSEVFAFLKQGGYQKYDMAGTQADINSFIEVAYGYSRKVSGMVTIGGRVKLLIGTSAVKANSAVLSVDNSDNKLALSVDNTIQFAMPGASSGSGGTIDLTRFQIDGLGVSGFGAAVDLGMTFKPFDGFEASLALNDLGGLSNNYNICGRSNQTVCIDNVTTQSDILSEFASKLSVFSRTDATRSFDMLPFNLNGGVRYTMPFYKGLSAGLFGTWRNYKYAPYWNVRLGATISPAKWFSFTADYGYGTYGSTVGGAFSISGGAFNFYLGAETTLGTVAAYSSIPLGKFHTTLNTGITFRF